MNADHGELVGAYVLDALEPEERAAFEDHLSTCSECQTEVAELWQVVDVLPLACEPQEPSPDLRDRILHAATSDDRPEQPGLTAILGGSSARRPSLWRVGGSLVAVAAAIALAVLGARDAQLQQQVNDQQSALAFQRTVAAALAQGATVSRLPGTAAARAASAAMVQPPHSARAYFVVQGLPPTPDRKVYQLWLVRGNVPRSARVFTYSGSDPAIIQIPMSTKGFPLAAVTVEPGPQGSTSPTGAKVLLGPIRS